MLAVYFVPVVTGTDDNGYHVAARMLERHGRFYQTVPDDLAFVGRMWVLTGDGTYYPKYPPLYPLLVAAAMRAFGDLAGLLLSPILAWSTVLATYLLCRVRELPRDMALVGAFLVATAPIANSFAVAQVSHATSLALTTWGYLLFFAARRPARPLHAALLLVASGLLLGCAAGVRYTDALLVLPGLVWLWLDGARRRQRLGIWLSAWAVPCALVAVYHWRSFGSPLRTAYSLTGEQGGFALSYLAENLRLYAANVPVTLAGPATLLACIGGLLVWRRDRVEALAYLLWTAPLLVTYMAYYWAPELHPRSYVRFLLPLLVPLTLLAVEALDRIGAALGFEGRGRAAFVAVVVLCQGTWGVFASLDHMELLFGENRRVEANVDLVREHVAAGSVVIGELDALDPLDYFKEHDLYWVNLFDRETLSQRLDRTLASGPDSLQLERAELLRRALVDAGPQGHHDRLTALLDTPLAEGRAVFLIGDAATRAKLEAFAASAYRLEPVARLPAAGRAHRLFEPGQGVSRAARDGGLSTAPFAVWRLRPAG
jgi:hypothetical protein